MKENEIDLRKIYAKYLSEYLQSLGKSKEASDSIAKVSSISDSSKWIIDIMYQTCKEVLELAANQKEHIMIDNVANHKDNKLIDTYISKKNILNIINKIIYEND